MPSIAYADEAHDSWDTAIQRLAGFVAGLLREQGGPIEDIVIQGTDTDDDGWRRLLFRDYDANEGPDWPAVGPVRAIRTDEFIEIQVW